MFTMKRMDLLLPCFLGDIASDLSQHASQVYLSTRRGCYMIKRLTPGTTVPFDHQLSRAESFVNKYFKRSLMADWVNKEYDFVRLGLQPTGILGVHQFPLINDDLPAKIITGQVVVKGELKELRETSVVLGGEDALENIDAVVFCTGFKLEFPFASDIIIVEDEKYARYKIMPTELFNVQF
jgi:dimethylaniline monooxygenase (N-oxide forming)